MRVDDGHWISFTQRRHTTASCSFSHSEYSSAAVKGLGCLSGPSCSLADDTLCGICARSAAANGIGPEGGPIVCDVRLEVVLRRVECGGVGSACARSV